MATVTGLTAQRMLSIEAGSVVDGEIVGGNLILTTHDGTQINAGPVIGPQGPAGPVGPSGLSAIPGEVKLWPGSSLPDPALYGKWVWADGYYYPVATYPLAAANIATKWRTFDGASDPGASNFRVPDLRGLVAAGLDQMPTGSLQPRAQRMTRAVAIILAEKTGKETHVITLPEVASHSHRGDGQGGAGGSVGVNVNVSGGISGSTDSHPGHAHTYGANLATDNSHTGTGNVLTGLNPNGNQQTVTQNGGAHSHGVSGSFSGSGSGSGGINADGGNAAHENVQPTVFVPYIVKLDG